VNIEGKDRLRQKLLAMPKVARAQIHDALDVSASEMAETARNFAPKKTGALAASIGYTFGDYKPENANVRTFGGGSNVGDPDLMVTIHAGSARAWYAALVEFGTAPHEQPNNPRVGYHHPGATARPYFFPAYRLTRKRVKSRITRATTKAAKAVAAGQS